MMGRDLRAELDAAQRKIQEHPGFKEHEELEALSLSIGAVFAENLRELMTLLDAAATDEQLAGELIQNVRPPHVRDQFRAHLTRRLHNYLASVQSLVEHVRRLMRGRTGPIADEFARRKATLLQESQHAFIVDLRNYTLHRRLPFFGHRLSISNVNAPEQTMESKVLLSAPALLEWQGWTSRSRDFLTTQDDGVDVRQVVEQHGRRVFELNSWLLEQLAEANAGALAEVNELIIARNTILTGGDREEANRESRWP